MCKLAAMTLPTPRSCHQCRCKVMKVSSTQMGSLKCMYVISCTSNICILVGNVLLEVTCHTKILTCVAPFVWFPTHGDAWDWEVGMLWSGVWGGTLGLVDTSCGGLLVGGTCTSTQSGIQVWDNNIWQAPHLTCKLAAMTFPTPKSCHHSKCKIMTVTSIQVDCMIVLMCPMCFTGLCRWQPVEHKAHKGLKGFGQAHTTLLALLQSPFSSVNVQATAITRNTACCKCVACWTCVAWSDMPH